ncbi:MocR-like pyridoxine biosynthesis transcription factor PdxR [Sphingomonas sp. PR090111-T3T-6A]|uniref:MocR-like pyridoxine biosynthesis transcription factor PdxR n=1 Tax=Sphingomonas sp. PR090111-T3T-6A TaxID=685778 RepID=UPI0003608BA5|nr:PLP-dependent aminotransferase family protein [Sphingomonas sp. PR090111-T3T-6A]
MPIAEQISSTLRSAIIEGRLEPGARLPSWLDMATQLGVARGTVKVAYETLADEALVFSAGAAGTRVAEKPACAPIRSEISIPRPLQDIERGFNLPPLPFQMGVPAQDAFPAKIWARMRTRAVRDYATAPVGPLDPRGHPELRAQIASYLAISRGIRCVPDQIFLTNSYRNGLALALLTLQAHGRTAWMEDPGYPMARKGLELSGLQPVPVPVDGEGLQVARGVALAPDAAVAVVTPGQQAPTGVAMSPARRRELLAWAAREDGWIIEDDYLSELKLSGRALPALAGEDPFGRVIHIGTFGKTLSPTLGVGFVVSPVSLAPRFGETAAFLTPSFNVTTQLALASFLADGHYLRHLRHMKSLYRERRDALRAHLGCDFGVEAMSGLAILMRLPDGTDDVALARRVLELGIAPFPLTPWYIDERRAAPGFLLGVTNIRKGNLEKACEALRSLVGRQMGEAGHLRISQKIVVSA